MIRVGGQQGDAFVEFMPSSCCCPPVFEESKWKKRAKLKKETARATCQAYKNKVAFLGSTSPRWKRRGFERVRQWLRGSRQLLQRFFTRKAGSSKHPFLTADPRRGSSEERRETHLEGRRTNSSFLSPSGSWSPNWSLTAAYLDTCCWMCCRKSW